MRTRQHDVRGGTSDVQQTITPECLESAYVQVKETPAGATTRYAT
ncbi:hypothetical protein [Streptomyces sp. NPDC059262]